MPEELLEFGLVEVQATPDAEQADVVVRGRDEFVQKVVGHGGELVHDESLHVGEDLEPPELGEHPPQGARVKVVLGQGLVHAYVAPPVASVVDAEPLLRAVLVDDDPGATAPRHVGVPKDAGRGQQDRPQLLAGLAQCENHPDREVADDVIQDEAVGEQVQ